MVADSSSSTEYHKAAESLRRRSWRTLAATRHSLGLRLLVNVVLFSLCVTLILTLLQLYLDYRRDVGLIELRLELIGRSYSGSLAEGLWNLDKDQLRVQLEGILRLPDISEVEVREAAKNTTPLVITIGQHSRQSAITRTYPLYYKIGGTEQLMGTLYVEATLAPVYRTLFATSLGILIRLTAETFAVSLFLVYIFHRLVTRHLFAIAAFVGNYKIEAPPPPLRLRRSSPSQPDELQRVVDAFNALSDELQGAYRSLHDANNQLARDVAARRQAEAVLREREARIRRLIDANIVGIFIWGVEGPILEANDAFLRIVGYDREDLLSGRLRWTDLTPPEWHEQDARLQPELKLTGRMQPFEKEYFRKDGSRVPVLIGLANLDETGNQGVAFVLDLTERKRAEAEARESERRYREGQTELAHANRLATMGQLTASIAHEVNQPIAAIVTNAQAALRWLGRQPPDLEEARRTLARIVDNGTRAGDVISRIRSLLKKAPPRMDRLELNELILEVVALARVELAKNAVTARTQLAPGLPLMPGDRVQLQQVVLNLIMNAAEAMSETNTHSRDLLVSTQIEPDGVLVEVRDSGPGLPPASLEHLFDAFYTTKPGGLGMGLSICRSIIEAHGGRIWASANEPRGATFRFILPFNSG